MTFKITYYYLLENFYNANMVLLLFIFFKNVLNNK